MTALLLLNGDKPTFRYTGKYDFVVCCDGAYDWAKDEYAVDLLMGDLDSVSSPLGAVKTIEFDTKKDYTDSHLALEYLIEHGYKDIVILGGTGGRLDHTLANLSLLYIALKAGVNCEMQSDKWNYYIADKLFAYKTTIGKLISISPFAEVAHILYTKGLYYPIVDKTLNFEHIVGISNVAVDNDIEIDIESGSALISVER